MSAFRAFNSRWYNASPFNAGPVEETQADSVTASDAVALEFSLALADSASASDASSFDLATVLADAATSSDSTGAEVDAIQGDSVTALDQAIPESGLVLNLSDSVVATDAHTEVLDVPVATEAGGWVRVPIRRWHTLALHDAVVAWDAHDFDLRTPDLSRAVEHKEFSEDQVWLTDAIDIEHDDSVARKEEELVLALV